MIRLDFATPLDARTVAARATPETSLCILPFESTEYVQIVVAQPLSWQALTPHEGDLLGNYFKRDAGTSFWWLTLRPAVFSLERLSDEVWVGHLREAGEIVRAGDDPRLRPKADHVFAVGQPLTGGQVGAAAGPIIQRDHHGNQIEVYRALATRIVRANFPSAAKETVWLRLSIAERERPAHATALSSELAVLGALRAADPACAAEVLHKGTLEINEYSGSYVAYRSVPGLPPGNWLLQMRQATGRRYSAVQVVGELLRRVQRLMQHAHEAGLCVGPLSPDLFRVRPVLVGPKRGLRVVAISLPGAGEPGHVVPSRVLDLYPTKDIEIVKPLLENGTYTRSHENDLRGLDILADTWLKTLE